MNVMPVSVFSIHSIQFPSPILHYCPVRGPPGNWCTCVKQKWALSNNSYTRRSINIQSIIYIKSQGLFTIDYRGGNYVLPSFQWFLRYWSCFTSGYCRFCVKHWKIRSELAADGKYIWYFWTTNRWLTSTVMVRHTQFRTV